MSLVYGPNGIFGELNQLNPHDVEPGVDSGLKLNDFFFSAFGSPAHPQTSIGCGSQNQHCRIRGTPKYLPSPDKATWL